MNQPLAPIGPPATLPAMHPLALFLGAFVTFLAAGFPQWLPALVLPAAVKLSPVLRAVTAAAGLNAATLTLIAWRAPRLPLARAWGEAFFLYLIQSLLLGVAWVVQDALAGAPSSATSGAPSWLERALWALRPGSLPGHALNATGVILATRAAGWLRPGLWLFGARLAIGLGLAVYILSVLQVDPLHAAAYLLPPVAQLIVGAPLLVPLARLADHLLRANGILAPLEPPGTPGTPGEP